MSKTDKKPPTGKTAAQPTGEQSKTAAKTRNAQCVTTPVGAYEVVTPDVARAMLALNKRNRNVIEARVAAYADAMRNGEWRITHQGIGIGADGELYDGQHRLLAVIQANVPVTIFVTRGLPTDARVAIDSGTTRSAVDNLSIVEGIKLHKTMGAAIGVLWNATVAKALTRNATAIELRDTMLKHLSGVEFVQRVFATTVRGVGRSGFIAAFAYAYPTAPEQVTIAAKKYYTGTGLSHGDPMYTLREFALRKGTGYGSRGDTVDDFRRALGMIAAELDGEKRLRVFVKDVDIDNSRIVARFAVAHQS